MKHICLLIGLFISGCVATSEELRHNYNMSVSPIKDYSHRRSHKKDSGVLVVKVTPKPEYPLSPSTSLYYHLMILQDSAQRLGCKEIFGVSAVESYAKANCVIDSR